MSGKSWNSPMGLVVEQTLKLKITLIKIPRITKSKNKQNEWHIVKKYLGKTVQQFIKGDGTIVGLKYYLHYGNIYLK